MARVRSRGTGPELQVRRILSERKVRYRLQPPGMPGRPDLYVARTRTAVFVNGCFWHQHGCHHSRRPKTNVAFWSKKLDDNVARDALVRAKLLEMEVAVLELWTCEASRYSEALEDLVRSYIASQAKRLGGACHPHRIHKSSRISG